MVTAGQRALGYLPRQLAAEIAPLMDQGVPVIVRKAPPLPRFGAYRGILELAYIPTDSTKGKSRCHRTKCRCVRRVVMPSMT
jgi:hypothetical protein